MGALLLLGLVAVTGCSKRAEPSDAGAIGSALAPSVVNPSTAAPSASACDGPVFDFGSQDRLRWGTEGMLVRRDGRFGIDLGRKIRFHTMTRGDAITGTVELGCPSCSDADRMALETHLSSMAGQRVRATGTLEPGWAQATTVPADVPLAVRLSVAKTDVALAPVKK